MLANGVEIYNYKSNDRVYYGPLSKFKVLNGGSNYDVLNPPKIEISSPKAGIGTTALVQSVVTGSLIEVIVDPQDFDIRGVLSASIVGGNGSGSVLQPIIDTQYRELIFDARNIKTFWLSSTKPWPWTINSRFLGISVIQRPDSESSRIVTL